MRPNCFFTILTIVLLAYSCEQQSSSSAGFKDDTETATLANVFEDNFYIGTALGAQHITGENAKATELIQTQFNAITPENIMKWMHIHPGRDSFNFDLPDQFVALGEANDMHIVGHTLVWHSQTAPWVNDIADSAAMAAVMEQHINTIMGRYKGRVHGWDVVNEALNEDGSLRESIFLKTMGEAYLKRAFDLAAAADPDAELYYNDYNLCEPAKRAGCIEMIKKLQADGTKIDGVGIQGHFYMNTPSLEEIEKTIREFSALGLKVMFTEVDISVLPTPWGLRGADVNQNFEGGNIMDPYQEGLPDSVAVSLGKRYADIFRLFLKYDENISRVTFWGVDDGHSWKNNFPIRGRTDYTLLFDRNQEPKVAFDSLMVLKRAE